MRRVCFFSMWALLAAGCSVTDAEVGAPPRVLDFGGGYVATLFHDGSFTVTRDGERVLATAEGVPLFGVVRDNERPDAWHDPAAEWSYEGADASLIRMDSPQAGELHLALSGGDATTVLASLALAIDDGAYAGLGERFDHVDPRGTVAPLYLALTTAIDSGTNEAHVPIPFLVSSKGYGVFVATREAGAASVGGTASEPGVVRLGFEGGALDVTLFFDPDPIAIVAKYTRKTGLPKEPPLWALAPMHWRNEWPSGEVALEDAKTYRDLDIPASCLWIDNPWQTSYNTSVMDPARFGDTKAFMKSIEDLGFRPLAWNTPYLERPKDEPENDAQALYEQAKAEGLLVRDKEGAVWPAPGCCHEGNGMLDFTSATARGYWQALLGNATGLGFAGFKLDYGEDLVPQFLGARLGVLLSDGQTERTGRAYSALYHRTYREALAAKRDDGFLIGRASTWGGQTEVDAIWPGDLDNGFQRREGKDVGGLPAAVIGAQSLSVSGFPSFGSDTGGYRGGMPTREALLRWAEHTAFSVIMQLGGGGDHHNPWLYDAEAGAIYRDLARVHMRLVPYLSWLVRSAATDGTPSIVPITLMFPDDARARDFANDEYFLGPDLLVAPVVEEGATSRKVYLPAGTFTHFFSDAIYQGPAEIEIDAPLGRPPVFVRAGSVIPLYPNDLDTLVEASDPSIVTLADRATDLEGRVFVAGARRGIFPNGSVIDVSEDEAAVHIATVPNVPANNMVLRVDLRESVLHGGEGVTVSQADGALPNLASVALVRASSASAYTVDEHGTLWLKVVGAAELTVAR